MAGLRDADAAFLDQIRTDLGEDAIGLPEPRHLEEPRGRRKGIVAAVVLPRTTEEVARIVALCGAARVGLVPISGGTGLVGGHTPMAGPVPLLVSLERMGRIREVDPVGDVMVAEAGVVLAAVQAAAAEAGRLFPLSLASEGSARIGGLLGTNAGGVNVLRYGNVRDLCLGVEAVLADGTILHGLTRVLKDNMGFDLRHLLIGSEGTLGIITAASLRLFPRPAETATAWIEVAGVGQALALLAMLRAGLGQAVSAFELIHRCGLEFLADTLPELAQPLPDPPLWSVLVEVADGAGAVVGPRLEAVLGQALEQGLAQNALVAQNEAQRRAFWAVRETIPEANRRIGSISSHDVSVPPGRIPDFLSRADAAVARIDAEMRINCFGHLGDGNLHYNVFPPRGRDRGDYDEQRDKVKDAVHDLVHAFGGSVGAEHGVGRIKTADMTKYGDPAKVAAMRAIKRALDPVGILNPGAVLPAE